MDGVIRGIRRLLKILDKRREELEGNPYKTADEEKELRRIEEFYRNSGITPKEYHDINSGSSEKVNTPPPDEYFDNPLTPVEERIGLNNYQQTGSFLSQHLPETNAGFADTSRQEGNQETINKKEEQPGKHNTTDKINQMSGQNVPPIKETPFLTKLKNDGKALKFKLMREKPFLTSLKEKGSALNSQPLSNDEFTKRAVQLKEISKKIEKEAQKVPTETKESFSRADLSFKNPIDFSSYNAQILTPHVASESNESKNNNSLSAEDTIMDYNSYNKAIPFETIAVPTDKEFSTLNSENLATPKAEFKKPWKGLLKSEVIKVRKSKKNIKKRLIIGIATVATALVLLTAGVKSLISRKSPNKVAETTIEKISETPDDLIKELDTESIMTEFTEKQTEKAHQTEGQKMTEWNKQDKIISEKEFEKVPTKKDDAHQNQSNQVSSIPEQANKEKQDNKEHIRKEEKEIISSENTALKIGETIQVRESTGIYRDELSAYLDEEGQNALNPYWSNSDEKIYLGGLYETSTGEFCYIYANDENANQKQAEIIQNGGKLLSALIAQPSEYYKVYDGENQLTLADINKCAAGWIKVGDIKTNTPEISRGMKR